MVKPIFEAYNEFNFMVMLLFVFFILISFLFIIMINIKNRNKQIMAIQNPSTTIPITTLAATVPAYIGSGIGLY